MGCKKASLPLLLLLLWEQKILSFTTINQNIHCWNDENYDSRKLLRRTDRIFLKDSPNDDDHLNQRKSRPFNLLGSSNWYSDRVVYTQNVTLTKKNEFFDNPDLEEDWGLNRENILEFPCSLDEVVNGAFAAVAGTLHQQQALDPSIASNAMSRSFITHRPVRTKYDVGRIGLEIDGVETLFPRVPKKSSVAATRWFSLALAAKLSDNGSWEPFESEKRDTKISGQRPVVVCFNTIRQALAASKELKSLKKIYFAGVDKSRGQSPYDNVIIQCIHDDIPEKLLFPASRRRRINGLDEGFVNATKGLLIVVQPTDYNTEFKPPGPAIDAVTNFQKTVAQAAVQELPVIALSPRFLSNDNVCEGFDQSFHQKSATYGGSEPPKGPTPWIMRDFTPPVYCWIGNALQLQRPSKCTVDSGELCVLTRLALTKSVMDSGHLWNVFAAKECTHGIQQLDTEFFFLGSTRSASGRPPKDILRQIFDEYNST